MNSSPYHTLPATRPLCPVCKKAVYSRGGIHPQCAMIRDEPSRRPKPPPHPPADPPESAPETGA